VHCLLGIFVVFLFCYVRVGDCCGWFLLGVWFVDCWYDFVRFWVNFIVGVF